MLSLTIFLISYVVIARCQTFTSNGRPCIFYVICLTAYYVLYKKRKIPEICRVKVSNCTKLAGGTFKALKVHNSIGTPCIFYVIYFSLSRLTMCHTKSVYNSQDIQGEIFELYQTALLLTPNFPKSK